MTCELGGFVILFIINTVTFGFVVTLEAAVAQSRNAAAAHESFPKDQGRSLRRPLPSEQELVNDNSEGKHQEHKTNKESFAASVVVGPLAFFILLRSIGTNERLLRSITTIVEIQPEQLNQRAVTILNRVTNKLTGRDFNPDQTLDVPQQVQKLILQATSTENLCQCWVGYCAFW